MLFFALAVLAATGCGSGGAGSPGADSNGPASVRPAGNGNSPPRIQGQPATKALPGRPYEFQPSVQDPDGDTVTFFAENLPGWADFEPDTGRIFGTPGPGDIGTTPDVTLIATDGTSETALPPFDLEVVPAGTAATTLTWLAPTENEDGSALLDLAGFRIYYGESPAKLDLVAEIDSPGLSAYTVDGLLPGNWFFAMTAVNSSGFESEFSNIVERRL